MEVCSWADYLSNQVSGFIENNHARIAVLTEPISRANQYCRNIVIRLLAWLWTSGSLLSEGWAKINQMNQQYQVKEPLAMIYEYQMTQLIHNCTRWFTQSPTVLHKYQMMNSTIYTATCFIKQIWAKLPIDVSPSWQNHQDFGFFLCRTGFHCNASQRTVSCKIIF